MRGAALALALALAPGCRDWRASVVPGRASTEPVQVSLAGAPPIEYDSEGYRVRLTPRATYAVTAYAVDTSRTLLDAWDFVVPIDIALVWGPAADPAVLRHVKFSLSRRYVSFWWDGDMPRSAAGQLPSHVANHHLIPASDEVASALEDVRAGDLVTLRGRLVDLEIRDAAGRTVHQSRTSLRRDDVGSGACEQLLVEEVGVERGG